ncbi:hypothetical protein, partial [Klebsiella variicola]|uniref:hypothetical protein n=1 Tax=Klebsiella variicola TaxID=244366 RepID=UPI0027302D96
VLNGSHADPKYFRKTLFVDLHSSGDHVALQPYFSYSRHSEKKPIVHIASDIAVTASFTGSSR